MSTVLLWFTNTRMFILIFYYRKKGTCTDKQELNERLITNTEETVKKVMKYFIQQI